jgi:cytochrome P450
MHRQPDIKAKLLEEVLPPVEAAKDNIVEGLEYDRVMEFEYLHQCFYETLRICPPGGVSLYMTMSQDTNVTVGEGK